MINSKWIDHSHNLAHKIVTPDTVLIHSPLGMSLGSDEGSELGSLDNDGTRDGSEVGVIDNDGMYDGSELGRSEGRSDGSRDGKSLGDDEGTFEGASDG